MMHSNLVLASTAVLVLAAGLSVGRLTARLPLDRPLLGAGSADQRSWLADQLGLRPDQRQQMDAIWKQTWPQMEKTFEARRDLDKQRDQAIQALLDPQQRIAYQKTLDEFRARREDLFKQRNQLMQDANAQSRALLDEDQQKVWDVLTKQMRDRHGFHTTTGPATEPTGESAGK
jgi:hypothetical protein